MFLVWDRLLPHSLPHLNVSSPGLTCPQRHDILSRLFDGSVLGRLASLSRPPASKWDTGGSPVRERHLVIQASQPSTWRWAHRHAWASYLRAAKGAGLLDDPEMLPRLLGDDDDGFRSAMSECCTAWYLAHHRRARVRPNPATKKTKNFDLVVERRGVTAHVEVKAPYVPLLSSNWSGDDAKVLRRCVEDSGVQFGKGNPNVVVLVPLLRTPVSLARGQLLKATIGEPAINVFVSLDGSKPPPPEQTFLQRGKLAKLWPDQGGAHRTDLTRVSAVMSIEQRRTEDRYGSRLQPVVVVVHNPFAANPLPPAFFGRVPQWITKNGTMRWSDPYDGP